MSSAGVEVPHEIMTELLSLHELSKQATGTTPLGDPRRQAGDEFCALAMQVVDEYGISVRRLSMDIGLSASTLRFALGRRGYVSLPPSQQAYAGVRSQGRPVGTTKEFCKRGHRLTPDNVYVYKDGRRCKQCGKARDAGRSR